MAFLDKLSMTLKNVGDKTVEIAKNVGDKTSDMLEIGKLSAQISSSNSAIEELKTRLGDHYWKLFADGEQLDDDAVVLCNTIKEYTEEIENLKAQLAEYRNRPTGNYQVCPLCGASNAEDAVYCKNCGKKLIGIHHAEPEAPISEETDAEELPEDEILEDEDPIILEEEETEVILSCDDEEEETSENEECCDNEECCHEAKDAKICPNCGAENDSENHFCEKCGAKL